jgi:hypothetical protein
VLSTSRAEPACQSHLAPNDTNLSTFLTLVPHSAWRHWGCVTPKILANVKKSFPSPSELDGFEDLRPEDQDKVTNAYEHGKVADEDIPPSARKADAEEGDDEKPKKRAAPKKKAKVSLPTV